MSLHNERVKSTFKSSAPELTFSVEFKTIELIILESHVPTGDYSDQPK